MRNFVISQLVLLLSVLHVNAVATPDRYGAAAAASPPALAVRQNAAGAIPFECQDYSKIANLSTISANSTYRSIFLATSLVGTKSNAEMLNAAQAKLPALMMNAALNTECGNLTTVAITEAANNLTKGIVAQFSGVKPGTIENGIIIPVIIGVQLLIFGVCWLGMLDP